MRNDWIHDVLTHVQSNKYCKECYGRGYTGVSYEIATGTERLILCRCATITSGHEARVEVELDKLKKLLDETKKHTFFGGLRWFWMEKIYGKIRAWKKR